MFASFILAGCENNDPVSFVGNNPKEYSVTGNVSDLSYESVSLSAWMNMSADMLGIIEYGIEISRYADCHEVLSRKYASSVDSENMYTIEFDNLTNSTTYYYRSFIKYITTSNYIYGKTLSFTTKHRLTESEFDETKEDGYALKIETLRKMRAHRWVQKGYQSNGNIWDFDNGYCFLSSEDTAYYHYHGYLMGRETYQSGVSKYIFPSGEFGYTLQGNKISAIDYGYFYYGPHKTTATNNDVTLMENRYGSLVYGTYTVTFSGSNMKIGSFEFEPYTGK